MFNIDNAYAIDNDLYDDKDNIYEKARLFRVLNKEYSSDKEHSIVYDSRVITDKDEYDSFLSSFKNMLEDFYS